MSFTRTTTLIAATLFLTGAIQCSAAETKKPSATPAAATVQNDRPDGELVDGIRTIHCTVAPAGKKIVVYRGEEVLLLFADVESRCSLEIPLLKVADSIYSSTLRSIAFKAKDTGLFTVVGKGVCATGENREIAQVVVREFMGSGEAKAVFESIAPKKAQELIAAKTSFVLDVRTPAEYEEQHIAGATLIPVQVLANRIGEIAAQKEKPVIVYCRAGNRSISASQILLGNGFTKVYNMQGGIKGWMSDGLPVETGK